MIGMIGAFLKGNAIRIGITLLITAMIGGGGWFMNNKNNNLEIALKHQIEASAIVTNEYERTLDLLAQEKNEFANYREDIKFLDKLLQDKQKEDMEVYKSTMEIKGVVNEVINEEDDAVSDVLIDALDGLRMLRESTYGSGEGEHGGDH